jgi:hypothetical protein
MLSYNWAIGGLTLQQSFNKLFPNGLVSRYLSLNSGRVPISSAIAAA